MHASIATGLALTAGISFGQVDVAPERTDNRPVNIRGYAPSYGPDLRGPFPRRSVRTGAIVSQGDFDASTAPGSVNAAAARASFGVDGSGIRIGIVADSFDALGGASAGASSGDLPPAVTVLRDAGGSDRGRAMAEIIHDIAPGAELFFASSSGRFTPEFADRDRAIAISELFDAGVDIIVDDGPAANAPFFRSGSSATRAAEAVEAGIAYIAAAGDAGSESWEGPLTLFEQAPGLLLHDFNTGASFRDIILRVVIPRFTTATVIVQWDQPTGAEADDPRGLSDLDAFLFRDLTGGQVDASTMDQRGLFGTAEPPVEIVTYENFEDAREEFALTIMHAGGNTDPKTLKVIVVNGWIDDDADTNSPTIFGQAASADVFTVGAAPFFTDAVRPSSSRGPARLFRDVEGNPIDLVVPKPDAVATDEVNNTFFGSDSSADEDRSPNFVGSAAAAAHAAGVAALGLELAEARGSGLEPRSLYDLMRRTTRPSSPSTSSPFASGTGLLDASVLLRTIDSGSCGFADLVEPFGVISQLDVAEFVRLFFLDDRLVAALAEPIAVVSQLDVAEFVDLFFAGCAAD